MDIWFRRSSSVQEARDIELPPDLSGDSVRFAALPDRYSRVLRLARESNPRNALPDKLCHCGMVLFFTLATLSLAVWGAVFANATLVLTFWAVLSVFAALPILTTAYIRQSLGLASTLHKFHNPSLTLTPDRLILEMKRHMLFRGKRPPTVRREMPYSRITRLEYDRASKTLKVSSGGSSPAALEIAMLYENSDIIVREIEKRCGLFIHPAMRGDDYADLRDLPGLKRDRNILRPMSIGTLLFCLASLLTALVIRQYNHNNPYMPYPKTQEAFLVGRYGAGDSVTLDGCDFTLNGVVRSGSDARGVCYQFLVTLHNHNETPIRMRVDEAYKDSSGNIAFTGVTADGKTVSLETSGPPPGYAGVYLPCPDRVPAGKNVSITFFVWVPEGAERVEMTINSDYWPPADVFRDVTYTGTLIEVNGKTVKSNEVRFTVKRSEME